MVILRDFSDFFSYNGALFGLIIMSFVLVGQVCDLKKWLKFEGKIHQPGINSIWPDQVLPFKNSWINTILPFLVYYTGGNKILVFVFPTTNSAVLKYIREANFSEELAFILVKVKEHYIFPPRFKSTNSWAKVVHCWWLVIFCLFSFLALGCDRITTVNHHVVGTFWFVFFQSSSNKQIQVRFAQLNYPTNHLTQPLTKPVGSQSLRGHPTFMRT